MEVNTKLITIKVLKTKQNKKTQESCYFSLTL